MYIYRFVNEKNSVIYIGKTKELKNRIKSHISSGHLPKECYDQISRIEYATLNDSDGHIYEVYLINKYKPKYNTDSTSKDCPSFILPELYWKDYKTYKGIGSKSKSPEEEYISRRVDAAGESAIGRILDNTFIISIPESVECIDDEFGLRYIEAIIIDSTDFESQFIQLFYNKGKRFIVNSSILGKGYFEFYKQNLEEKVKQYNEFLEINKIHFAKNIDVIYKKSLKEVI